MLTRLRFFLAIVCALLVAASAFSGKPAPAPAPSVTSVLADGPDPLDPGSVYAIASDQRGAYYHQTDGVSSSLIGGYNGLTGDWELNALNSTVRRIRITLSDPLAAGDPFGGTIAVPARVLAKCSYSNPVTFPGMSLGQQLRCPLVVRFDYAGATYRLDLWPEQAGWTDYARVTCTGFTTQCVSWTVEPDGNHAGEQKSIARLVKLLKGGKLQQVGDFYLTFSFSVTRP